MKRFILTVLAVLVGVAGYASNSHAAWTVEQLKWTHPSNKTSGVAIVLPAAGYFIGDTTYIPLAASKVDTSTTFSLLDCDMPTSLDLGRTATTGDSLALAWVIITADSSVASSVNFKNSTAVLQVNYGSNLGGWQTAISWAPLPTDGQKVLALPIWTALAALTNDLPIDLTSPTLNAAPMCRVILTGGSSVACPMASIKVKKFRRNVVMDGGAFSQIK